MTHSTAQPRTAFSVVTGFLGAGKTTLLRRLLHSDWKTRNLAFIINDLAEMDVDGQILSSEADGNLSITRLASGCVCCTIKGEFEQTVDQIIQRLHPDALIVESSGVANPAAVLHGLNHPALRLDSVICVIDAERFMHYARLSAAVEWQVYMADFVLINKAELVAADQLATIEQRVRQFNAKCAILRTSYCDVSPDVLFGAQVAYAERDIDALVQLVQQQIDERNAQQDRPADDHDSPPEAPISHAHSPSPHRPVFHDHLSEDAIDSFVVTLDRPLDERKLTDFLKSDALREVYRAKGFIHLADVPGLRLFNFVPRRFSVERFNDDAAPHDFVIFIGRQIAARKDEVVRRLRACQM
ncbi:MAG: GTP-binding protein [Anaerolineae bacterium]|nr:GTP-binding protein [Thermoflexales bacterium]MDW8407705.1 GTP-binding protein [Anaerolineae bacterium]